MAAKATLDPDIRLLYGNSLRPPSGYVFDSGVGTTYSLDFETALAVPVCLALFSAENKEDLNLLALLEGAERIAGRLLVFCETGSLHAEAAPQSRRRPAARRTSSSSRRRRRAAERFIPSSGCCASGRSTKTTRCGCA